MTTFHAVELNNTKYPNKDLKPKKDVKIIIGNATIYIPSDDTKSLKAIIKELNYVEPTNRR